MAGKDKYEFNQTLKGQKKFSDKQMEYIKSGDVVQNTKDLIEKRRLDSLKDKIQKAVQNGEDPKSLIEQLGSPKEVKAAEDVTQEKVSTDMRNKVQDDIAKMKVGATGQPLESNGKIFYYNDGEVKSVELNRQIKIPSLTGTPVIDTMRLESYADDIGKRIGDISKLIELGRLDEKQAYAEIMKLDEQRTNARSMKNKISALKKGSTSRKALKLSPKKRSKAYIPRRRKLKAIKI